MHYDKRLEIFFNDGSKLNVMFYNMKLYQFI